MKFYEKLFSFYILLFAVIPFAVLGENFRFGVIRGAGALMAGCFLITLADAICAAIREKK